MITRHVHVYFAPVLTARWGSGKQCVTVQRIVPMALIWDYRNVPWKHNHFHGPVWWVWCGIWYVPKPIRNPLVDRFTAGMVDEFRVIFDIIDSNGSGELDLLGVKRACGLLGQKRLLDRRSNRRQFLRLPIHLVTPKMCFSSKRMRRHLLLIKVL